MQAAIDAVKKSFNEEIDYIKQLNLTLKEEQVVLTANDIDGIESILPMKSLILKSLSIASKTRHHELVKLGFECSEKGMKDWLATLDDKKLVEDWSVMQTLLNESKELNRLNAMLVNKFMTRNEQTIEKIKNRNKNNPSQIYGANGMRTKSKPSGGSVFK